MQPLICIVTGSNRGIGKEVCRQLAELEHTVILTARKLDSAQATVDELGLDNLVAHQLDVTDDASIQRLHDYVAETYGYLDVLVNNAAIHYDTWQRVTNIDFNTLQEAVDTNLYGPWKMSNIFLPLLKKGKHPRIVNVSSGAGELTSLSGGTPAYSMTKLALNGLTQMLARSLSGDNILVNAVCPGWVATDMGGSGGRPIADGADGIVWAATLPDDGATGGFFRDRKPIDW